jgi:hypothetical protein
LEANSDSPQKAQLIERELIVRLLETLTYYKSNMSPHIDCPPLGVCADTGFELLDPASLPERPTPDPVAFATLGSLLGLIAGIVWESGRRR